jgi:hypothetical protein
MITYKVLYKNYKLKKGELMGVLVERRKDLRGKSLLESGLRWAKSMFGRTVKNKHWIFVVPHELNLKKDSYACGEDDIQQGGILGKEKKFTLRFFRFSPSKRLLSCEINPIVKNHRQDQK